MAVTDLVREIKEKFGDALLMETTFLGETTLEVNKEGLKPLLAFLKQRPSPGYEVLMDLTGVDYLQPIKRTKLVYLLHNPTSLERLRITLFVPRDEAAPSVVDLWEGANWYERELYDLFGISFEGHPHLVRILMPDDWRGHPLRKDYALTEEPVEFKHGVKPKVPSEIITKFK